MDSEFPPNHLHAELTESLLTESEADELRSFILSLAPKACLVQPDGLDVFGIDETMADQIIAKLDEIGAKRVERRRQTTTENQ
jgi:hypothetical protein